MKILFLVSRFPYPLEKGDKLRAYQHIQNMKAAGHDVHLVALSDCKVSEDYISKVKTYCDAIHIIRLTYFDIFVNLIFSFFRSLPLQVGYFYSKHNFKVISKIISECKPDVLYCQLIRTALFVRNINTIPKLIDYQDAFSMGTFQRMQKAPFFLKPIFVREHKLLKSFEEKTYNWFDRHLIISGQDLSSLGFDKGKPVSILPNGIDVHFFNPQKSIHEFHITFVGNMNYPPNVDAAKFLVREIMPLVWKEMPELKVQLAGANPGWQVKELATKKVKVTGWVEDIRDCYKNTMVFIAPMRIGTGLQNKLLEAMAMNVACVTTPISFEPLGAIKDSDILVGNDAKALAKHLLSLISDGAFRERIAMNGHNFVVSNYSMEKSGAILNEILTGLKN